MTDRVSTVKKTRKNKGLFGRGFPRRTDRRRRPHTSTGDRRMLRASVRARGLIVRGIARTRGLGGSSSKAAVLRAQQQQQQQQCNQQRGVATTTRAMSRFGDVPEAPKVRERG